MGNTEQAVVPGERAVSPENSWGCFPISKIELENALSKLDKMRLQKHKANEKVLSHQCT